MAWVYCSNYIPSYQLICALKGDQLTPEEILSVKWKRFHVFDVILGNILALFSNGKTLLQIPSLFEFKTLRTLNIVSLLTGQGTDNQEMR